MLLVSVVLPTIPHPKPRSICHHFFINRRNRYVELLYSRKAINALSVFVEHGAPIHECVCVQRYVAFEPLSGVPSVLDWIQQYCCRLLLIHGSTLALERACELVSKNLSGTTEYECVEGNEVYGFMKKRWIRLQA